MEGIEVAEIAQQESQKRLRITCVTCGISKAFYTPHGARYFTLIHLDHEIRSSDTGKVELMKKEVALEAPSEELVEGATAALPTLQLEKFVVRLVTSGDEKKQSLRVRGIGPKEKTLFVLNFPVERASAVRALIHEGEYINDEIPPMGRYTWTPQLLDTSDQVSSLLGLQKSMNGAETPKEAVVVSDLAQREKLEGISQPEAKTKSIPVIQRREIKDESQLLLAKSSYIQENEKSRNEATKISRVLMEFRWNIAPPYGINVLFDDNVSIQSNTGVISAGLVKKIEEIGYRFVAFEAAHGAPTAWFKRNRKEDGAPQPFFPDSGELILPQSIA